MNLDATQTTVLLPPVEAISAKKRKAKRQKKASQPFNIYYKQDIAGLWVFMVNKRGNQELITPYPITGTGHIHAIKSFIDENYD